MKDWQDFCQTQDSATRSSNFICDASELGVILVTGEDALTFLQNQLSNDIAQIDETRFQLSSYSTPKGRLLAIFKIVAISNGYLLILPASLVAPIVQRLQMYIIQAKVSIADASSHFARFALHAESSQMADHPLLAKEEGEVMQTDNVISIQLTALNNQQRHLMFCLSCDEAKTLWNQFAKQVSIANFESWRLSEIKSGMPVIYPQTSENFVLQMANLDIIDGVSFKKGCYPGQEIVARTQYLGKLKRRLFLATLNTSQCPLPGDEICTRNTDTADGSGKVVDAIMDETGVCHCIYIAQIQKSKAGELRLLLQPDIEFTPAKLPYSFPEAKIST